MNIHTLVFVLGRVVQCPPQVQAEDERTVHKFCTRNEHLSWLGSPSTQPFQMVTARRAL
jgi:hypothetical protein